MLESHYPHLHSLSTVGIIHHGNYDYELNPWCTSFAGESGLGKSIIADLLQLIFVGPQKGVYESATQSTDERLPEGLVLSDEQGRKGIGYAFVTIAKAAGSYLTIGCYLEPGSQANAPFIVQQSHDFSKELACFDRPLGYRDFLDAEQMLLPPRECQHHLENQHQVVIKFYASKYAAYHDCLYRNGILPLDVGSNPSALRSYAKIIRSFARSGDLVKKDADLKDFLFGIEKEKTIREEYKQRVTKMNLDQLDYQRNAERADKATQRVTNLRELSSLQRIAATSQRDYLGAAVAYAHQQMRLARQHSQLAADRALQLQFDCFHGEAEQTQREATKAAAAVRAYGQQITEQKKLAERLEELQADIAATGETLAEMQKQLTASEQRLAGVAQAKRWMDLYGTDPDKLTQLQRQHQLWRQQRQQLTAFETQLQQTDAWQAFEASTWGDSVAIGNPAFNPADQVAALQATIAEARRWRAFADINDPESLAMWAWRYGQPLTEEQESILAHFSHFTHFKGKEEAGSRYLADAAQLLFSGELVWEPGEIIANGFWLNLDGVREWITRLPAEERLFAAFDQQRIRQQFQQRNQQVELLEAELNQAQQLLAALKPATEWLVFLPLYAQRATIRQISEVELLPADAAVLAEQLAWLSHESELLDQHQHCKQQVADYLTVAGEQLKERIEVEKRQAEVVELLRDDLATRENVARRASEKQQEDARQRRLWLDTNEMPAATYAQHRALIDNDVIAEVADELLAPWLALSKKNLPAVQEEASQKLVAWQQEQQEYQQAKNDFEKALREPCPEVMEATQLLQKTSSETRDKQREIYQQRFAALAASYVGEATASRYQPEDDLGPLIEAALSDTLEALVHADSDTLLDQAERQLRAINERSAQIAERKMKLLGELFEEVEQAVEEYQNEIGKISRYFQRGKTPITGGLRPVLKKKSSERFPLEWLRFFRKVLRNREEGDTQIFQSLGTVSGMDELMRGAFQAYTQQSSLPTVAELLNPKSYLELEFYMAFPNGEANRGSTGQTFMFAALLNIARLSIIGRDQPGIRFMAIDEAHGLGSNLTTLLRLARTGAEKYQLISLSVEPLLNEAAPHHKQYFLFENLEQFLS